MGTITRGTKAGGGTGFNSGQTIDPAEVNTDFNTVYTEFNGIIQNVNISATAAIALTKVAHAGSRVYNSLNISVASDSATLMTFDTERYDTDAFHSTSVNTGRFTVPTGFAGQYLIIGHIEFVGSTNYERQQAQIRLNGTTVIGVNGLLTDGTNSTNALSGLTVSTIYDLAVSDYVELLAYQSNGAVGAKNVLATANYSPEFIIAMLGT